MTAIGKIIRGRSRCVRCDGCGRISGDREQGYYIAQALLLKVAPKGKITNGADAYLFDMRGPALMQSLITSVAELERERDALARALRQIAEMEHVATTCAALFVNRDGVSYDCDCPVGIAEAGP